MEDNITKSEPSTWSPKKFAIIGSGSWATALAKILIDSGNEVYWYFRFKETVRKFQAGGHNPSYLTSVTFDLSKIHFYTDVRQIIKECDTVLLVTPSPYIKSTFDKLHAGDFSGRFVLNAVKGIIPEEYLLISDYLTQEFEVPEDMIGVISGPTHAEEVAMDRMSYLTVACSDLSNAEKIERSLQCEYVRTVVSSDVNGIEYCSVLKNVYAIASGICQGLRMGDNFQAVLIANAAAEMDRFTKALSTTRKPITDSVYLGDLLVTGYSHFSRNRTFGNLIGKGRVVKQAQLEMDMVAEGYYGAKCIHEVNKKYKVFMPIAETVYQILYHMLDCRRAVDRLTGLIH